MASTQAAHDSLATTLQTDAMRLIGRGARRRWVVDDPTASIAHMTPIRPERVRPTPGAGRSPSRIVALRHAQRIAARPGPVNPWPRVLALVLIVLLLAGALAAATSVMVMSTAVNVLSAGLPDPSELEQLTFAQPTVIYDRTGKVELATFQSEQRRVVTFTDVPPLVLDATTSAEDRTFWANSGYDAAAILSAVAEGASGARERGASTITQQLVRARLLPTDVTAAGSDKYVRKAKEIIQSLRLSDEFPGEAGKQRVITAYLNEIFYGHGAYGVAAAALIYFGISDLSKLTPVPGGPAGRPCRSRPRHSIRTSSRSRVPMAGSSSRRARHRSSAATGSCRASPRALAGRRSLRRELADQLAEPVVLVGDQPRQMKAAHFDWQVRRQLNAILGDANPGRDRRLHGHHDPRHEGAGPGREVADRRSDRPERQPQERRRAAQVAQDPEVRPEVDPVPCAARTSTMGRWWRSTTARATSSPTPAARATTRTPSPAGSSRPSSTPPETGPGSPGSAFKPILYASAFDSGKLTPGSLLLDITTEFNARENWAPRDADQLERGPVLVRKAFQYSLNIPAIRALQRVGNDQVDKTAEALGSAIHRRPEGVPAGGAGRRDRHGRGQAAST